MTARAAPVICLHGPESVGKSMLAQALATHLRAEAVHEYGRDYCEIHGTDLTMADIVEIGRVQTDLIAQARSGAERCVVADTDALMTAVWADMMLGERDPWFAHWNEPADLYLLLDIDLPFIKDALRIYGADAERQRFFDLCKAELETRGVRWRLVSGLGDARLANALEAIEGTIGPLNI
jgi:NadR type nicotinamide-nucleotide adenylyltransferase